MQVVFQSDLCSNQYNFWLHFLFLKFFVEVHHINARYTRQWFTFVSTGRWSQLTFVTIHSKSEIFLWWLLSRSTLSNFHIRHLCYSNTLPGGHWHEVFLILWQSPSLLSGLHIGSDRCESWTIKKAEHQRIDAFELWCWRKLLRVP